MLGSCGVKGGIRRGAPPRKTGACGRSESAPGARPSFFRSGALLIPPPPDYVRAPLGTLRTAETLANRGRQILLNHILAEKILKPQKSTKSSKNRSTTCALKSVLVRICQIFRTFPIPNPNVMVRSPKPTIPFGLALSLLFLGLPSPPLWGPERDPVRVLRVGDWPFGSRRRAGVSESDSFGCSLPFVSGRSGGAGAPGGP